MIHRDAHTIWQTLMYKGKDTHGELKTVGGSALKYFTAHGFKEEVHYTGDNTRMPNLNRNAAMERVVPHVTWLSVLFCILS